MEVTQVLEWALQVLRKNNSKLPDGLRVIQEWIAYQSGHGQLTVSAAESLLKTFNFCLENNMLRAEAHDQDTASATRLPLTLDALRRKAGLTADRLKTSMRCAQKPPVKHSVKPLQWTTNRRISAQPAERISHA
ncbi:hypothetical protein RSOL_316250, partial [Rhizoctonia solani AG-3 Rhs1AP]